MRIIDALNKMQTIINIPFEQLFTDAELNNIIRAKGKTGQILELALGLKLTSSGLDFEDGELKTNKCDASGKPLETMFICQISSIIDELLENKRFADTYLFSKIDRILYVPVCKVGHPKQWYFYDAYIIDRNSPEYLEVYMQLENDYYHICSVLKEHIDNSGNIHTSNGELMQVRSKDSKPYHPIFSNLIGKYISNKNHAFYFKKEFMKRIKQIHDHK